LAQGRRKLLVADDSPTVRKVISLTFEDEGAEVVAAADGAEALRLLQTDPPPDLIFADAVMPAPDGYELCERVKRDERLRHVPVVLLVGAFEPFNEAEARRVGADTVLTKPFQSIRDLVNKVGSLVGGGSKEAEREEQYRPGDDYSSFNAPAPPEAEARRGDASPGFGEQYSTPRPPADDPAPAARAEEDSPRTPPGADEPFSVSDPFRADPSSSFADLGEDDQMIEARPADAFGAQHADSHQPAAPAGAAPSPAESEAPFHSHVRETREAQSPSAYAPGMSPSAAPSFAGASEVGPAGRGHEQAFAARASAASTADDALLDLGGFDVPASPAASVTEADDFILDLEDDAPAPSGRAAGFWDETSAPAVEASAVGSSAVETPARVDEASAFAEASHGGTAADAAPSEFDLTPRAEAGTRENEVPFGVVSADAPRFDAGAEALSDAGLDAGDAPRGFLEPTVVPADEPAAYEREFTDGSVEGDRPKPPAEEASARESQATTAAAPAFGEVPSTAGYAVGAARVGLEEQALAGRLSPAEIEAVARRVVEMMSDEIVREIAWEVVPDLAELMVRRKLEEERK
jgi:CheY-like chemotaxis protein